MTIDELKAAWTTITKLMDVYKVESNEWANLCETKRLIEVELRELGFDSNILHD